MKIDAIYTKNLFELTKKINELGVPRDNIVNVFLGNQGMYVAVFYI